MGEYNGQRVGTFGDATAFSMHPLKIINVWGDAGIVVTNDDEMNKRVRLLRNHGLRNRDEMEIFGYNSRLDSTQAVVGKWIVRQLPDIVAGRIAAAAYYDKGFDGISGVTRAGPAQLHQERLSSLYSVRGRSRRAARALPRARHRGQDPLPDPAASAGCAEAPGLQARATSLCRSAIAGRASASRSISISAAPSRITSSRRSSNFYAGKR